MTKYVELLNEVLLQLDLAGGDLRTSIPLLEELDQFWRREATGDAIGFDPAVRTNIRVHPGARTQSLAVSLQKIVPASIIQWLSTSVVQPYSNALLDTTNDL